MILRHGDVILERINAAPRELKKLPLGERGVVLAEGEATGHAHRIQAKSAELFLPPGNDNGTRILVLRRPACLRHEEHKTLTIPAGIWKVRIKRQYSPAGWERVQD